MRMALLLRGQQTIFRLFPEMREALLAAGATPVNMGRDMRWFHFGVWKRRYDSRARRIVRKPAADRVDGR